MKIARFLREKINKGQQTRKAIWKTVRKQSRQYLHALDVTLEDLEILRDIKEE